MLLNFIVHFSEIRKEWLPIFFLQMIKKKNEKQTVPLASYLFATNYIKHYCLPRSTSEPLTFKSCKLSKQLPFLALKSPLLSCGPFRFRIIVDWCKRTGTFNKILIFRTMFNFFYRLLAIPNLYGPAKWNHIVYVMCVIFKVLFICT